MEFLGLFKGILRLARSQASLHRVTVDRGRLARNVPHRRAAFTERLLHASRSGRAGRPRSS